MDTYSGIGGLRETYTATIANGAALSSAIALGSGRLAGIQMPAGWTTANLTFQVSYDGTTFVDLYDDLGVEVVWQAAASRFIIPSSLTQFLGVHSLKVRSGTTGTPVNQGANRALQVVGIVL